MTPLKIAATLISTGVNGPRSPLRDLIAGLTSIASTPYSLDDAGVRERACQPDLIVHTRREWLYNMSGFGTVASKLDSGKSFLPAIVEPERLTQAILRDPLTLLPLRWIDTTVETTP